MGFTTTIVAVCLLAVVAEGYIGQFNNFGFRGFPQMQFPLLPQPPRLPGFPQFPFVGNNGFFNFPTIDVANAKPPPGGNFHGIAVSSTSDNKGGSTVILTNNNGVTETFSTDPQRGIVVSSPPFPEIIVPKIQVPEFKIPEFPKMKPVDAGAGPTYTSNYQGFGVSSSRQESSVNGGPPKVFAQLSAMTNDNGNVKAETYKFSNVDDE